MSIDPIKSAGHQTRTSAAQRSKSTQSFAELHAAALKDAKKTTSTSTSTKAPSGETYDDVAGRSYDEIVSGKRNGMFINRSGNARDGQAFVRVVRDEREFHIYGSGKARTVVSLPQKSSATDASASA